MESFKAKALRLESYSNGSSGVTGSNGQLSNTSVGLVTANFDDIRRGETLVSVNESYKTKRNREETIGGGAPIGVTGTKVVNLADGPYILSTNYEGLNNAQAISSALPVQDVMSNVAKYSSTYGNQALFVSGSIISGGAVPKVEVEGKLSRFNVNGLEGQVITMKNSTLSWETPNSGLIPDSLYTLVQDKLNYRIRGAEGTVEFLTAPIEIVGNYVKNGTTFFTVRIRFSYYINTQVTPGISDNFFLESTNNSLRIVNIVSIIPCGIGQMNGEQSVLGVGALYFDYNTDPPLQFGLTAEIYFTADALRFPVCSAPFRMNEASFDCLVLVSAIQ